MDYTRIPACWDARRLICAFYSAISDEWGDARLG